MKHLRHCSVLVAIVAFVGGGLVMLAVGLWGAQLGAPAIWILPVTFPVVMAFGGMLGLLGVGLPGIEVGIAVSAVLLGAMVMLETRPSLALARVQNEWLVRLRKERGVADAVRIAGPFVLSTRGAIR